MKRSVEKAIVFGGSIGGLTAAIAMKRAGIRDAVQSQGCLSRGTDSSSKRPMHRFVSPPLPPGKYMDTIKAIIPGPDGPRAYPSGARIDVRPATSK